MSELFELLAAAETDFTIFFRNLATPTVESLRPAYYAGFAAEAARAWLKKYRAENRKRTRTRSSA